MSDQQTRGQVWAANTPLPTPVAEARPQIPATPNDNAAASRALSRRHNTGVRFPPGMYEQLTAAAAERDVSVNWLVNRAVVDFLSRLLPADEIKWTRPS